MVKPTWLSKGASAVWDELAPLATEMGTLTVADSRAFGTLCELQATLVLICAQKDDPAALPFVVRTERATANALRPYYSSFGLTPLDRGRLPMLPAPRPDDFDTSAKRRWAPLV